MRITQTKRRKLISALVVMTLFLSAELIASIAQFTVFNHSLESVTMILHYNDSSSEVRNFEPLQIEQFPIPAEVDVVEINSQFVFQGSEKIVVLPSGRPVNVNFLDIEDIRLQDMN